MSKYSFEEKWGPDIANNGFTQIPSILIINLARLSITSSEFMVLTSLLKHAWTKEDPYPAHATICSYTGFSESTVKRNLISLEDKQLIKRIKRGKRSSNGYNLSPLEDKLNMLANEKRLRLEKQLERLNKSKPVSSAVMDP